MAEQTEATPVEVNAADNWTKPTTAPYDPRFSVTNQTKNCWTNYIDFHRCVRIKGHYFNLFNVHFCQFFASIVVFVDV
jgi:carbonic anhydrase